MTVGERIDWAKESEENKGGTEIGGIDVSGCAEGDGLKGNREKRMERGTLND